VLAVSMKLNRRRADSTAFAARMIALLRELAFEESLSGRD
jgi:hypothetical protein